MFLIDNLIEKIAGKALMNLLLKAKTYMDGKKTYTGSILGIAGALVGYFSGNVDAKEASAAVWLGAMFIFREASAAAKLKKEAAAKEKADNPKVDKNTKSEIPVPVDIPGVTSPWPA